MHKIINEIQYNAMYVAYKQLKCTHIYFFVNLPQN
jgi:hypothetical protein